MMNRFSMSSFVAGIMLGALMAGAWFWRGDSALMTFSSPPPLATSTAESIAPENGTLSVANQVSGDAVVDESDTVPPPGVWVAVREIHGTDLGNVLGAARAGGPQSAFVISLLRATVPGRSYAVELYRDDGGDVFNPSANSVYIDFDTGAPAIVYFTTTD